MEKIGKWDVRFFVRDEPYLFCTECDHEVHWLDFDDFNYCPWCGSKNSFTEDAVEVTGNWSKYCDYRLDPTKI